MLGIPKVCHILESASTTDLQHLPGETQWDRACLLPQTEAAVLYCCQRLRLSLYSVTLLNPLHSACHNALHQQITQWVDVPLEQFSPENTKPADKWFQCCPLVKFQYLIHIFYVFSFKSWYLDISVLFLFLGWKFLLGLFVETASSIILVTHFFILLLFPAHSVQ